MDQKTEQMRRLISESTFLAWPIMNNDEPPHLSKLDQSESIFQLVRRLDLQMAPMECRMASKMA